MADRRDFLIAALAGGTAAAAPSTAGWTAAGPVAPVPTPPGFVGVDGLGLSPESRADLETFAEPVLREVAYLAELPLDGLDPAFVYVPRR